LKKYDVIIIGSGLSGLICGTILSREGKKVCILEQDVKIGGCLQTFTRDGRTFDTGVHYIGGYEKGQNLWNYFNYLKLTDKLKVKKLDENNFDKILFLSDSKEYNYAIGHDKFYETMASYFPKEKNAIKTYIHKLREICKKFPLYNLEVKTLEFSESQYFFLNAYDYIKSITNDTKLQAVLAGINPIYGGAKNKSPFYVHALITNSFIESAYRLENHSMQIAEILSEQIKNNGGKIYTKSKVNALELKNREIKYIHTEDGKNFEANTVISSIHPKNTINLLTHGKIRNVYKERIFDLENTIPGFIIYLNLKNNFLNYMNYNYYCFNDYSNVWTTDNYRSDNWPLGCFYFTPIPKNNNTYAESLNAIAYMKYDEVKKWGNSKYGKRPKEYENFKDEKCNQLISYLSKIYPNLKNNITSYYASTPLTLKHYTGTYDGSLYGILKDSNNPMKSLIMPKTPIPNLLLTGQNTVLHGVLGVTISAVMTCSVLLGREYLLDKIKAEN
jgi:all-trans-retinol 13,14-reductase